MNANWIHFFGDPLPVEWETNPAECFGGKGAGLDQLTRLGFGVPRGFVIVTDACRFFFENGETWPSELEDEIRAAIARLEEMTGTRLGGDTRRLLLAIRSGAAVSMPGMMDTVLNVGAGATPWEELVTAINAVLRSWNSDRALAWRSRGRVADQKGTAVNVQIMVPAEVSGVVFTRNPERLTAPQLAIEAIAGLGDALVSGEVTPERLVVSREGFHPSLEGRERPFTLLSSGGIAEIGRLALLVEARFGAPQDIEWALADGRFALLQTRPIRGWDEAHTAEQMRLELITRLRRSAGPKKRLWVAHNLGETLSFPTPITWDVIRRFMSGAGGFGRMYRGLGYEPSDMVCRDGFLELFAGRVYADPERAAELFWAGVPLSYDIEELARDPGALNRAPRRIDPDKADGGLLFRLPRLLQAMVRCHRQIRARRQDAIRRFEDDVVPRYSDWIRKAREMDLHRLSEPELIEEFERRRVQVLDEFGRESLQPAFLGGLAVGELQFSLNQLMGPSRAARLVQTLTASLPGEIGAEQDALLERVAAGDATLCDFLEKFGHRTAGEMDLMTPRWREDHRAIAELVETLRTGVGETPSARRAAAARRREEAEHELPGLVAEWGGSAVQESIEGSFREAQTLLPYRERGRHLLMMGYGLLREVLLELGRRWEIGDEVFFLEQDELKLFRPERDRLARAIARRELERRAARRIDLPEVILSTRLNQLGLPVPPLIGKGDWKGSALSPGIAAGSVVVALAPDDAPSFRRGDILVCPSTDPGWMPLLLRAGALVVERGGLLSHGAIVARDLGLPAVVLPGATMMLSTGQPVRVDGNAGCVIGLEEGRHG